MTSKGTIINLIKKLAQRLTTEKIVDANLILNKFLINYNRNWNYLDDYEFYISRLSDAEDSALIELHEYLFPGETLPSIYATENDLHWKKNYLRIFISHSTTKKLLTSQIKSELDEYGIDCFVAHEDIEPTTQWLTEIKKALVSSNVLVAIICNEFPKSLYCDQEVGYALALDKVIIPIRLEKDPYGFMSLLQGVNAFQASPTEIAANIFNILDKNIITSELLNKARKHRLEVLIDDFLNSSNFSISTELLRKIESHPNIPFEFLKKISEGWVKNNQIFGLNGIQKRMNKLLEKFT